MKKVMFAALLVASAGATTTTVAQPNMDKYNKSCAVCHSAGVAGAPKTGNAEAWAPRLEKGMDALVTSVKNGLNAMPAKGGRADLSDEEVTAAVEYMLAQ